MSIESARAYIDRLRIDKDFANKVASFKDSGLRLAFAKDEGFDFSAEDIRLVIGELGEESLNDVVGGYYYPIETCCDQPSFFPFTPSSPTNPVVFM